MTATLVASGLAGGHGHRTLFDALDLTVAPGDVVGVVGANGAGKSTLLRILGGDLAPQAGTVSLAPSDAFVGWLPQEHKRVSGETVAGYIARRTGCAEATREMDASAEALADPDVTDAAADRYNTALTRWLASGAADLEERIPAVLADLGLDLSASPEQVLMTSLSGGQAARVGLAALLLSRFDVVLLDEPTNDLDLDGLTRLEAFVQELRGGVVLVSHDREFLARSVTRVLELDLAQRTNRVYGGGYEAYLEERATLRRQAREKYEEFAEQKQDLVSRARVQREWSSQGVRNAMKKSPDNDKLRRKANSESSEKQAQKVRQMESRIARLEEVEEPRKEWRLEFTIGAAPRSSSVVATLNDAVFRLGGFTLGPVSLQVNAGERIGITGPNGAGKSTLLRGLLGRQAPDEGTAALGSSVQIGEIDQARSLLAGTVPLAAAVEALVPEMASGEVRTLLAKFGLRADHVNRPVDELSPGERTRASLALLQARGVNVLVLDEPTNHLDLEAIEQLEQALETYEGALMLVTHDRRMLDTVRTDRRWQVQDGRVTER
ncbi:MULTISPECIES: ABC-F family ATP-binding cassette domain-containing protein [Micrococcus]|uniref:ATPase subunit of ABC transporter with duplicated ATPase domains n=1 Tax=Micrococcus yunnanensis TaxID=566027 RepID=A0ABR6D2N7_9MICC|nr:MULTISPECIES: ABC-F family ATP-binding cassette domain-containing protein [Micrococcus]MBA9060337.1 ATPase subunit of ABC transporter with duplicated ATPase domains [Micrococcus yunnanensis]MBF0745320.1 ABC-F family ATP-binding cassette domain-containing protein [Micrococcus yunnanensis]MBU8764040.1 ATP-binding cassette domain-containing protein [Micrococcus luteus]MCV7461343.1 ATP-binding cassette domain-containing protein [Micrococcus luteus]MCV7592574.1 ATP-binding cassette domain-contai